MRSCGKPRGWTPDGDNSALLMQQQLAQQQQQIALLSNGQMGMGGMGGNAESRGKGPDRDREPRPGEWKCLACGNLNYPSRTFCNMRSCGKPRGWTPDGDNSALLMQQQLAQQQQQIALLSNAQMGMGGMGGNMLSLMGMGGGAMDMGLGAAGMNQLGMDGMGNMAMMGGNMAQSAALNQSHANAPPGSWICEACGNLNYATRTKCNSHKCGLPRSVANQLASGVAPNATTAAKPQQQSQQQLSQPGNWTCPSCGNINYPSRMVCNRYTCKLPRPENAYVQY